VSHTPERHWRFRQLSLDSSLRPNQALKLTVASWVQFTLRVVVFRFCYSVFSTYNFDTYQFGYQHELVSFSAT
jgi:hypothetical protein